MSKAFVGIGFGPIQRGHFLLQTQASGNFERRVAVEVQPALVTPIRRNSGRAAVNIARVNGLSAAELHGLEKYNPLDSADVPHIVDAIASADAIATAFPSIDYFQRGPSSSAELLARGFKQTLADHRMLRAVVYTAENHNYAAESLETSIRSSNHLPDPQQLNDRVAILNTVIGIISGVVNDYDQLQHDGLMPLVQNGTHAVLVEELNSVLTSKSPWPDFERGISVFQEKSDLLPFEEVKLYGHNAAHALLEYLAYRAGCTIMHGAKASLIKLVTHALLDETGAALCHRQADVDPLFTKCGWESHSKDLMQRLVNPHLQDRVDRVIRDPRRKLAWNERLIGTMRLAIDHDVDPSCFAIGAATATKLLFELEGKSSVSAVLNDLWETSTSSEARNTILQRIERANATSLDSL